jgi:hypothetical protein
VLLEANRKERAMGCNDSVFVSHSNAIGKHIPLGYNMSAT